MPDAVDAYLATLDEPRRTDIRTLHERVQQVAPGLVPRTERQFLVYGTYHFRYASGREGDWYPLAIASNKAYISVYAPPTIDIEPLIARMPKANLGRACIRFKRVSDIELSVLDEVFRAAAAADGKRLAWDKDGRLLDA